MAWTEKPTKNPRYLDNDKTKTKPDANANHKEIQIKFFRVYCTHNIIRKTVMET